MPAVFGFHKFSYIYQYRRKSEKRQGKSHPEPCLLRKICMGFQSFFCVYFSARKSNMIDKCVAVRYNNTVHFMTLI